MADGSRFRRRTVRLAVLAWAVLAATEGRAEDLLVGAAARPLTLGGNVQLVGVPLAGFGGRKAMPDVLGQHPYAHYFPPGRVARSGEEIRAKALVVKRGEKKLAFVSLDMVGVDRAFRDLVVSKLEALAEPFDEEAVILSATHTHSGPGALTANHFLEFNATDRLHEPLREGIASQVVAVVEAADSAAEAAELYHLTADVGCTPDTDFGEDATCPHMNRSRAKHHGDHRLSVLAARATGSEKWIGAMINFAVHGTAYRDWNDQLSADYPGVFERAFAKAMLDDDDVDPTSLPVLFLNGAEGDMTPTRKPPTMKDDLAELAKSIWKPWWLAGPEPLEIQEWHVAAPEVELGRPFLYLRGQLRPLHDTVPFSLLGLELSYYFPTKARIWSFSLGGIRFMSVPGEPTTDVGLALRKVAAGFGFDSAWILGLTNDHLGYFVSPEDWALADYESGAAAYGAFGAQRLVNQHQCILEDL